MSLLGALIATLQHWHTWLHRACISKHYIIEFIIHTPSHHNIFHIFYMYWSWYSITSPNIITSTFLFPPMSLCLSHCNNMKETNMHITHISAHLYASVHITMTTQNKQIIVQCLQLFWNICKDLCHSILTNANRLVLNSFALYCSSKEHVTITTCSRTRWATTHVSDEKYIPIKII